MFLLPARALLDRLDVLYRRACSATGTAKGAACAARVVNLTSRDGPPGPASGWAR